MLDVETSGLDVRRDRLLAIARDLNALRPFVATFMVSAENGDGIEDLVAKIGRASRLGERSLGVLDAGAVSCCLILTRLADSVQPRLSV